MANRVSYGINEIKVSSEIYELATDSMKLRYIICCTQSDDFGLDQYKANLCSVPRQSWTW